jgi:hypothetical protein
MALGFGCWSSFLMVTWNWLVTVSLAGLLVAVAALDVKAKTKARTSMPDGTAIFLKDRTNSCLKFLLFVSPPHFDASGGRDIYEAFTEIFCFFFGSGFFTFKSQKGP